MENKKILIVEDDRDLGEIVATLLTSKKYSVSWAQNGKEALEQFKAKPDLVLLDRSLPDINGLDVCVKIKEEDARSNRVTPVIILSGSSSCDAKVEGLASGADDYVTKPFETNELIARIEVALRRVAGKKKDDEKFVTLVEELKALHTTNKITPFFQPIYSLETNSFFSLEVLSRPPRDSIIANPEIMFKVAVETDMYFDVEEGCWRRAISKWKEYGSPHRLFFNCSPYFIENINFSSDFILSLGVNINRMVFEITEHQKIDNYNLFLKKINEIKNLGVSIAVDDVGSGFSSLDTVAEIKPNFLKIDLPLIRDIDTDALKLSIVESIISFSKKCNIKTIAEGIETKKELNVVKSLGVDLVQGYFLAKPSDIISPSSSIDME